MAFKEIEVDRTLLNPKFEGYKLSLDVLPVGNLLLGLDLDLPKISSDLYSYQHVKLFGTDNKLFRDPWDDDSVWFIDGSWNIMRAQLISPYGLHLSIPKSFYSIPKSEEYQIKKNRIPVSLSFSNENWMVVSDGAARLMILKTFDRKDGPIKFEEWYNAEPLGNETMFRVFHSEYYEKDGKHYLEVLCAHISEGVEKKNGSDFHTNLEWLTFVLEKQFELHRRRTLQTVCVPEYGVIVNNGTKIVVCSERAVNFVYDSKVPVIQVIEDRKVQTNAGCEPLYTWNQKVRDINVSIPLNGAVSASDVDYRLTCDRIQLKLKSSSDYILDGQLSNKVSLEQCSWSIIGESLLEIHLEKLDDLMWNELVVGDIRGQYVLTEEQMDFFTSETKNDKENMQIYNSQELEECDFSENSLVIHLFDGNTHNDEQQVSLIGQQWLFSSMVSCSTLPVICIRHDVDGLVLKFENSSDSSSNAWKHVATFNAYGYVQASKQQRKYTVCAPDFSFVAIVEVSKHIFIYRQPSESSVMSRKTREKLKVAKHQMVALETNHVIEGVVATNNKLFVLTEKNLYCIRTNSN